MAILIGSKENQGLVLLAFGRSVFNEKSVQLNIILKRQIVSNMIGKNVI